MCGIFLGGCGWRDIILVGCGGGGHFSGWVWVSVVFFWVGVGGVTLFWLDVGECGIRDSPDDY